MKWNKSWSKVCKILQRIQGILHPKEVEATLIKIKYLTLLRAQCNGLKMQILRYSKKKSIDQHHSNSESLKEF